MGRPRGFDEADVIRSAAELFAGRSYDGTSIDDLVAHLGVHRNSLYKTFGSKRGLYLAALKWSLDNRVAPVAERITEAADPRAALAAAVAEADLDLLILAAVELAPGDAEVAGMVGAALAGLDRAADRSGNASAPAGDGQAEGAGLVSLLLGLRIRARFATAPDHREAIADLLQQ